jgi:DNA-nicking Smr family endonuclease
VASRARVLSEADQALWAAYARMIDPLRGRPANSSTADADTTASKAIPLPSPPTTVAAKRLPPVARTLAPRLIASPLAVGDQPGGLDKATWQRFCSGKLPAARTLDLHGLTLQSAHQALVGFIRAAYTDRLRCVEVVTGRGSVQTGGTIRREVPHWLNQSDLRPMILGAVHPHALNPGSVRLLLRRVR